MAQFLRLLLVVGLSFSLSTGYAQVPQGGGQLGGADGANKSGPRKQLATIVFAGLAGAVLGLSTLSFYGRPQDKLSNIAIGFAIGVIAGTLYTTYRTATQPYDYFEEVQAENQFMDSLKSHGIVPVQTAGVHWKWDF